MKKALIIFSILFIFSVVAVPTPTSADTKAGLKPGNFFYFLDTGFEKINLFFIFNSEKKAEKALEYANERLAEIKEIAEDNKPELVEKALAGYEEKISLATEKSKEIKDEEKAEKLLNIVSESTAKHQVILESVLEKVPEEAKEAILNAIEASKKGYEQALRQVAELRRENEQLKKDIEELKSDNENDNENENETEEISEKSESKIKQAKYETETAHAKAEAEKYKLEAEQTKLEMEKLKKENEAQKQKVETQTEAKKNEAKTKHTIFTLPSGAVIEMDENGNFIKTIQEAPIISTTPAEQTQTTQQKMTINRKTEQTEQDDHEFVILSFIPVYANVDYEIPPNQQLNHYKMEIQFGDKKNSFNNIEGNLKICLENSKMQGTTYINGQQYSSSNISIYDNFTENELILTNPFVFKNNLIRLPETADEYDNYLLTAIYKDQKYIIKLSQYINFEIRPECEQIIIDYQNDERINKYKSHYKIKETIQKELQKIKNQYYSKMTTEKCYTSLRYQTLPRHQSGKI